MKIFILKYLLIMAAITGAGITAIKPAQAQSLPDISVPQWLQPYKQQLWNFSGLGTLAFLAVAGAFYSAATESPKKE